MIPTIDLAGSYKIGPSGVDYGWATWNPNDMTSQVALSDGDATATFTSAGGSHPGSNPNLFVRSTAKSLTAGKLYCEFTIGAEVSGLRFGFVNDTGPLTIDTAEGPPTNLTSNAWVILSTGDVSTNHTADITAITTGMSGYLAGDTGALALDLVNGKAWLKKNGVWFNSGDPAAGTNPQFTGLSSSIKYGIVAAMINSTLVAAITLDGNPLSGNIPAGFTGIANSPPESFMRFIRLNNFTGDTIQYGIERVTFSEIVLLNGGTDITPDSVQCSYSPPGSHPEGGYLDPTLRLVDGLLISESSWIETQIPNSDFYIKFDLNNGGSSGANGIKFARGNGPRVADGFAIQGSYDDITYTTLLTLSSLPDVTPQTYSAVYTFP